jgi:hypothetical protein
MTDWIETLEGVLVNAAHVETATPVLARDNFTPDYWVLRNKVGGVLGRHRGRLGQQTLPAPAGWFLVEVWPFEKQAVDLNPILAWSVHPELGLRAVTVEGTEYTTGWFRSDWTDQHIVALRSPDGAFWVVGEGETAQRFDGEEALLAHAEAVLTKDRAK